jgi:hypothetical protein
MYMTSYRPQPFLLNKRNVTIKIDDPDIPIPVLGRIGDSALQRLIGGMNRLVAGVLLTQTRVETDETCGADTQTYPHRFPNIMPSCTMREGRSIENSDDFGVDPIFVKQSKLYVAGVAANQDQHYSDDQLNPKGLPYGFRSGKLNFPIFFDINMNSKRARLLLDYLTEGGYVQAQRSSGSSTLGMTIRFLTYNANYKVFTLTRVEFAFDEGGAVKMDMAVQSFDVELFDEPTDILRLLLELLFMFMLLIQIVNEAFDFTRNAFGEQRNCHEPCAYFGLTGCRICVLRGFGLQFWFNLLDLASIGLFVLYFILWWSFIFFKALPFSPEIRYPVYRSLDSKANILAIDPGQLSEMVALFDECESIMYFLHAIAVVTILNMGVLILRLFKQLDFQEQFNIVTQTIIGKLAPLLHFFFLFGGVQLLFAVAGMVTFGSDLKAFSSFDLSLWTGWKMLMGDLDAAAEMYHLGGAQVTSFIIFYGLYMIINFFLLLNVLLAIIVEGYTDVSQANQNALSLPVELAQIMRAVTRETLTRCGANKPMSISELNRVVGAWIEHAAANRVPNLLAAHASPGDKVVQLRMELNGGETRLVLPTKEELREIVQQHFENMGKTMSDGDEESIEAWVSSVMLYFSDYPRTDLFPEEIREEHAEARRLCGRGGGPPLQKKASVVPTAIPPGSSSGGGGEEQASSMTKIEVIESSDELRLQEVAKDDVEIVST